jgi:hypothetical protein
LADMFAHTLLGAFGISRAKRGSDCLVLVVRLLRAAEQLLITAERCRNAILREIDHHRAFAQTLRNHSLKAAVSLGELGLHRSIACT